MRVATGALLLVLAVPAFAQDAERGKLIYDTHCGGCHYERVHDRLRTRIQTLDALRDEVARWAPQTGHRFSPDDERDVAEYLNVSHYRIGLPPKTAQPPRN